MKHIFLSFLILFSIESYSEITVQVTVVGYGKQIIIAFWKDFKFVEDTLRLDKNNSATRVLQFSEPTYVRLETIGPESSTAFLLVLPEETISISKNSDGLTLGGSLKDYNTFVVRRDSLMRAEFKDKRPDFNTLTKYLIDLSDDFFRNFRHARAQMIHEMNNFSVLISYKFYPVMVRYSADSVKMNKLYDFLKNPESGTAGNDDLLTFLDRLNLNSANISFVNDPDMMMLNNFIRILRMRAIERDSTLQDLDEYVIENGIIRSFLKASRFRSRLLAYNLYFRIDNYTQYPMRLAGVDDFIAGFQTEKFNSGLLSAINDLYTSQKNTIGSLSIGANAPDFKLPDANGRLVSLSDFKGKVVYIDVWASWCGPCLAEMRYMKPLKEKFKNKGVELVSISIDTRADRWLAKIAAMNLDGIQLIDSKGSVNSKIAKDYQIHGVPHYVLIDKNGKIASPFAPRPSSQVKLENEINKLLD